MPTLRSNFVVQSGGGAAAVTLTAWANNFGSGSAVQGTADASLLVFPLCPPTGVFPGNMTANTMLINMVGSLTATASNSSHTFTASVGLYTLANSTQLSLLNSASTTFGSGANNTGNSSLYNGGRQISLHSSQWSAVPSLSQTHYWLGFWMRSSRLAVPMSISGFSWIGASFMGYLGVGNTIATSYRPFPGMGVYSTSFTTAMPGSLAFSQLVAANTNAVIPTVVIHNIGV
ncbi:MAG: hypothetical protein FD180_3151 [Planctomycetota bacterium]|nr:MAG: hypothetical protein FD180_3151 [Planctomycetota bacterium]